MVQLYGVFELFKWKGENGTDYNSTVIIDSHSIPNVMFHTPLDRSFTCKDIGNFQLYTTITYNPMPHTPVTLPNTTVNTADLKFDAFRNFDHHSPTPVGFRVSCTFFNNLKSKLKTLVPKERQIQNK